MRSSATSPGRSRSSFASSPEPSPERTFPASVVIQAFDRKTLTRDVTSVLADEHISISAMNVTTNAAENTAQLDITVTVHGLDEYMQLKYLCQGQL